MNRLDLLKELAECAALPANWDSDGADAANPASVRVAEAFIRMLTSEGDVQLHGNGNAGLVLRDGALIADIEFHPDKVALYAECCGVKFKGSFLAQNYSEEKPNV